MKKILIAVVGCFAVGYLLTSFVLWDLNPGHWGSGERLGCLGFVASLVVLATGLIEIQKNK